MARKSRREYLTPDLTPLIDVVFLLLIFFMVSSVFKKEELALLLNLPKTQEGKSQTQQKSVITRELSKEDIERLEILQKAVVLNLQKPTKKIVNTCFVVSTIKR